MPFCVTHLAPKKVTDQSLCYSFLVRWPCSNRSHPALTLAEKYRLEGKYRLTSLLQNFGDESWFYNAAGNWISPGCLRLTSLLARPCVAQNESQLGGGVPRATWWTGKWRGCLRASGGNKSPGKIHLLSQNPAVIKMAVQPPATGHLVGLEFLYDRIPVFKWKYLDTSEYLYWTTRFRVI